MSDNKLIINTFDGGLNWDSHITNQNPTTYRYALNAIEADLYQNSFISNEHGNRLVKEYGAKITGKIYLQSRNSTLYFLQNGELHLFSHRDGSSKFVCSDKEFGCNWYLDGCEYIEPIYKHIKGCKELHVYWSSACESNGENGFTWDPLFDQISDAVGDGFGFACPCPGKHKNRSLRSFDRLPLSLIQLLKQVFH
jgi:hypothetical protein